MYGIHDERINRMKRCGLYVVTSREFSGSRSTLDIVKDVLAAGVKLVQLREKALPKRELLALADAVRKLTNEAGALLIINDHVDVALASGADGVHLGQDDFPVGVVRRIAPDLLIGASTHSPGEAREAQAAGASYVNIGPLFSTRTKVVSSRYLGLDGMKEIAKCVNIPVTVMGGIKMSHIPGLVAAGAETIAVVTAVIAAENPRNAAAELLAEIERCKKARV